MCSDGVGRASTRTTPFRTVEVWSSCAEVGTIPGQSIKYIRRVRVMYCQTYINQCERSYHIHQGREQLPSFHLGSEQHDILCCFL